MARPTTIDDAKLLKIAREIFLEKGARATAGEVARRAGIAQGSIFRRYKTKADLFRAAMLSENFPWMDSLEARAKTEGLEKALIATGVDIIAMYRKVLPIAMMTWSHRGFFGGQNPLTEEMPTAIQSLFEFFQAQMELGAIRKANPFIVAAGYVSPLLTYAMGEMLGRKHPVPVEMYVASYVHLLWGGLSSEPSKKRKAGPFPRSHS